MTSGSTVPRAAAGGPVAWVALAVLLALAGAGLVGQLSHPPGSASRAELTWSADGPIEIRLDAAVVKLTAIETQVETLSGDAKKALATLANGDAKSLQEILEQGQQTIRSINLSVNSLRAELADLSKAAPDAAFKFSNATLVRRGAVFAALDATRDLASRWDEVGTRGLAAASLTITLRKHNDLVAQAAERGRAAAYADAVTLLGQAQAQLELAREFRADLFPTTDRTVLDDWLDLHAHHDDTLTSLYSLLEASGGTVTTAIRNAYRNELTAREALPDDNRAILAITGELARQGLNQAVLAIEAARAQLDQAIAGVNAS